MGDLDRSAERALGTGGDVTDVCQAAIEALERGLQVPPMEVAEELCVAERAVVKLRDRLIDQLRRDPGAAEPVVRSMLDRVNVALSLIVGAEYPSTGIQRQPLEAARDILHTIHTGCRAAE